jgi:hypothetical protein
LHQEVVDFIATARAFTMALHSPNGGSMSHLLTMALMREFPGVELNRLLIEHPEATVVGVKGAKFVVVPLPGGQTAYYAYRQGSLHRLNSAPLALRTAKGSSRNAAGVATASGDGAKHTDPKLANWLSARSGGGPG